MAKPTSFTSLPLNVRVKIYKLAGLTRRCPIDLGTERLRKRINAGNSHAYTYGQAPNSGNCTFETRSMPATCNFGNFENFTCYCPILPSQLLQVSRQVHAEATQVLYGQNMLRYSYTTLCGFSDLQKLSEDAWSSMTSLSINMQHVKIHDWHYFCTHMSKRISPSQLMLNLVYHVDSLYTAEIIGESFRKLPSLRGCSIRFNTDPETFEDSLEALGLIAKNWALKLSDRLPSLGEMGSPDMLNALPVELKRMTLMNTDLISNQQPDQSGLGAIFVRNGKFQFSRTCCKNCTDSLMECNCPFKKAGWSYGGRITGTGYSTSCTCDRMPLALFSIGRNFNGVANDLLYSFNRFILYGNPTSNWTFLRSRPASTFRQFRAIDFVIDAKAALSFPNRSTRGHDWAGCMGFIAKSLELSQLWLSLDMRVDGDPESYYNVVAKTKNTLIREKYPRIVEACTELRGLKRFHVFLSFEHSQEAVLEQMVMGPTYNSEMDGKLKPADRDPKNPHKTRGFLMR